MNRKVMRLAASFAVIYGALTGVQAWGQGLSIEVLSSFPELVTGGDALVKITGASTAPNVTVGARDVSAAFVSDGSGGWIGLVDGLVDGDNALAVSTGGGPATLTLTNHPINGTLFAGPQQTPFVCENETHGLAPATDESCAAPTITGYTYRSTEGTWKPFDPNGPRPTDIDKTTTIDGKTVPLINWYEKGIINRSAYVISLLHDPAAGPLPMPVSNETGWNGKLIMSHRGGVRAGFHQGRTIGTLDPERGYVGGENNNLHRVPDPGRLRNGRRLADGHRDHHGSRGPGRDLGEDQGAVHRALRSAEVHHQHGDLWRLDVASISIAQSYPGLYDAILPWRSYSDVLTFQTPLNDCNLLVNYFEGTKMPWTDIQKREVSGKLTYGFCTGPATRFPNLSPDNCDSSVLDAKTFEPEKWKDVRCTYQDNLVNVYGIDPETGLARSPSDNVGVQYGLRVFNDGIISFDQFAELNARIGGHGINGVIVPGQRARANPDAVRIAYETGPSQHRPGWLEGPFRSSTSVATRMASARSRRARRGDPTNVDVHDGYHTLIVRARLLQGQRER